MVNPVWSDTGGKVDEAGFWSWTSNKDHSKELEVLIANLEIEITSCIPLANYERTKWSSLVGCAWHVAFSTGNASYKVQRNLSGSVLASREQGEGLESHKRESVSFFVSSR